MIEVLASGPANGVQDLGRPGLLHLGISRSGAMDRLSARLGNAMLGNADSAAVLELAMFPVRLRVEQACEIALAGADARARVNGTEVPPFWALPVAEGAEIVLEAPENGARSYLAVRGGIDTAAVLGARATDFKSGFGGHDGRGLKKGDRLPVEPAEPLGLPRGGRGLLLDGAAAAVWSGPLTEVEVGLVSAAEAEAFTPASRAAFFDTAWEVGMSSNRMGYSLAGPELALTEPLELLSHGLLPGTVQVPPSGQPIVQLADANTCGGYPKMGVVIATDLWRIAQLSPGGRVRFREVSDAEGLAALEAETALVARARALSAA